MVELNRLFEKHLFASLENYTDPIPGVIPTLEKLRAAGIKIGSTTGYTREMMDVVLPAAQAKGYHVDYCATPNLLPAGPVSYTHLVPHLHLGTAEIRHKDASLETSQLGNGSKNHNRLRFHDE